MSYQNKFTLRLAIRWFQASGLDTQLDQLLRVRVLEGVAEVPYMSWFRSNSGSRALAKAQAFFAENYPDNQIDPSLLSLADSGLYKGLKFSLKNFPREEVDDIMQTFLSGIYTFRGTPQENKVLYTLGKSLKDRIISGQTTQKNVFFHLKTFLKQTVSQVLKTKTKYVSILDGPKEIRDEKGSPVSFLDKNPELGERTTQDVKGRILDIIGDPSDALGERIRDTMKRAWFGLKPNHQVMLNLWLNRWLESDSAPRAREVLEMLHEYNIKYPDRAVPEPPGRGNQLWQGVVFPAGMKAFVNALQANKRLVNDITWKLESEGIRDLEDFDVLEALKAIR